MHLVVRSACISPHHVQQAIYDAHEGDIQSWQCCIARILRTLPGSKVLMAYYESDASATQQFPTKHWLPMSHTPASRTVARRFAVFPSDVATCQPAALQWSAHETAWMSPVHASSSSVDVSPVLMLLLRAYTRGLHLLDPSQHTPVLPSCLRDGAAPHVLLSRLIL